MKIPLSYKCKDLTDFTNYIRFDLFNVGSSDDRYYVDIQMMAWFACDADAEEYNLKTFEDRLSVEPARYEGQEIPGGGPSMPSNLTVLTYKNSDGTTVGARYYSMAACIDRVNGVVPDPQISCYHTNDYQVATHNGITAINSNGKMVLKFTGWAAIYGGQSINVFWSIDGIRWFQIPTTGGDFQRGEDAIGDTAFAWCGGVRSNWVTFRARFSELEIDLSAYKGKTLNHVYFARSAASGNRENEPIVICHLTNVIVPS
jgi:hypothetical protein